MSHCGNLERPVPTMLQRLHSNAHSHLHALQGGATTPIGTVAHTCCALTSGCGVWRQFKGVVASRLTHPYLSTFSPSGSLPFNVLSNSAEKGSTSQWQTTSQLSYTPKSPDRSGLSSGIRTEAPRS